MRTRLAVMFTSLIACTGACAQEQRVFHDELLDHLVGRWDVTGTVHGTTSKQIVEAEWILNHQFLRITQKTVENVHGADYPYEGVFYIGYDNTGRRYIVHLMNVWGADSDALGIGQRIGDEMRVTFPYSYGSITNRFIWQPESKRWHIVVQNSKSVEPPYVDLEATKLQTSSRGR